jgi:hypothetical protein
VSTARRRSGAHDVLRDGRLVGTSKKKKERGEAPFDFSSEARRTNAAFWERASPVVLVLRPGEVVLVPRGWWHYAAALDPSVTAMKNFYDAETNLEALARVAARLRR